jgi:hypothetical protein
MPSRGMKKLRKFEKMGLVVLCVVMLVGLGVSSTTCEPLPSALIGSFQVAGEEIRIEQPLWFEYQTYLTWQRLTGNEPPPWKFARGMYGLRVDPQFQDYDATVEDVWTFVILHHVAERAGVRITRPVIEDWIRRNFKNPETGEYSREQYENFLRYVSGTWPTAREFEKFVSRWLAVRYFLGLYRPLMSPTKEQIYDTWKIRNRRHTVTWAVQPMTAIRAEIEAGTYETDEKLEVALDRLLDEIG